MLKIVASLLVVVVACSAQKSIGSYPYLGAPAEAILAPAPLAAIIPPAPLEVAPQLPMTVVDHGLGLNYWNGGVGLPLVSSGVKYINRPAYPISYVRPVTTYGTTTLGHPLATSAVKSINRPILSTPFVRPVTTYGGKSIGYPTLY